jgi:DNA-binding CsgD family transcriptional regulator
MAGEERLAVLTPREREVLTLVGRGLSNDEIGAELFRSPATARTHASHAMGKLGARDRAAGRHRVAVTEHAVPFQFVITLPDGTAIRQGWNAQIVWLGDEVRFSPPPWSGPIPVGTTFGPGFLGTGPVPPDSHVAAYVNGARCDRI